jgi:protein phosphatase-4 regulatory subunit 3
MVTAMDTRRRVKVYQLDEEGKWQDKGTGHVTCTYVEQKGTLCLVVKSEEDSSILLESKIYNDDIYQRQQDTLIVWSEPDANIDLALSFQEAEGCQEIWDQIASVQQRHTSEAADSDQENGGEIVDEPLADLPPANIGNLDTILETIAAANSPLKKERFVMAVIKEDYVRKLLDLFSICEDLEAKENLHKMFIIFKNLILMNETNLMEILFSEEHMIPMMGALEYDPDIPDHCRMKHREFLTSSSIFKQVIPFNSQELVEKIHQTFRMQFLKDVVLNRVLDDGTFATLNSLIFFNNIEIVTQLQSDTKFLSDLFVQLQSKDVSPQQRKDLLLFLQELCNLAKNLQIPNRMQFYRTLVEQGLFEVFTTSLNDADVAARMASTEIILSTLGHDPSLLRAFIVKQKPRHELLSLIIEKFTSDPDLGIKSQCAEILKVLLDTEALGEEPGHKEDFLNVFYQDFIHKLVEPLKRKHLNEKSVAGDLSAGFVQNNICELLSYCVRHHGYRIKYFLLGNNIVKKVLKLLQHRDKYLILSAIRFFRAFVGAKDDFYNRHIIKNNLFAPIVEVFERNGPRYNLINSAILELFDFARRENVKVLVPYLVETFGEMMNQVEYVDVFRQLRTRYEQLQEHEGAQSNESTAPNGPRKTQRQMEEEDEEAYFRESDDEEEEDTNRAKTNHISARIVDYDEDDEVLTSSPQTDEETDTDEEKEKEEKVENGNGPVLKIGRESEEIKERERERERKRKNEDDFNNNIRELKKRRSLSPPRSPPLSNSPPSSPRSPSSPSPFSPNSPTSPLRPSSPPHQPQQQTS